jgi:hypothetical protein
VGHQRIAGELKGLGVALGDDPAHMASGSRSRSGRHARRDDPAGEPRHPDVLKKLMEYVERAREDLGDSPTNRSGKNLRPGSRDVAAVERAGRSGRSG